MSAVKRPTRVNNILKVTEENLQKIISLNNEKKPIIDTLQLTEMTNPIAGKMLFSQKITLKLPGSNERYETIQADTLILSSRANLPRVKAGAPEQPVNPKIKFSVKKPDNELFFNFMDALGENMSLYTSDPRVTGGKKDFIKFAIKFYMDDHDNRIDLAENEYKVPIEIKIRKDKINPAVRHSASGFLKPIKKQDGSVDKYDSPSGTVEEIAEHLNTFIGKNAVLRNVYLDIGIGITKVRKLTCALSKCLVEKEGDDEAIPDEDYDELIEKYKAEMLNETLASVEDI